MTLVTSGRGDDDVTAHSKAICTLHALNVLSVSSTQLQGFSSLRVQAGSWAGLRVCFGKRGLPLLPGDHPVIRERCVHPAEVHCLLLACKDTASFLEAKGESPQAAALSSLLPFSSKEGEHSKKGRRKKNGNIFFITEFIW